MGYEDIASVESYARNPEHAMKVLRSIEYQDVAFLEICEMKWFNVKTSDTLHDILLNGTSRTRESPEEVR